MGSDLAQDGQITDGSIDSRKPQILMDILQFSKDFRTAIIGRGDSARMCAAVSGPLCAALRMEGVACTLLESDLEDCNHVFIRLQDGRVLDATADQFNGHGRPALPAVYLGEKTDLHDGVPCLDFAEVWHPLLVEFKRLADDFTGAAVGGMVRLALATLPGGMVMLPERAASSSGDPQSA